MKMFLKVIALRKYASNIQLILVKFITFVCLEIFVILIHCSTHNLNSNLPHLYIIMIIFYTFLQSFVN